MRFFCTAFLASLLLWSVSALAVEPSVQWERDVDDLEDLLPRHETVQERELWRGREQLMPKRSGRADTPPAAPIRSIAEWEPATGVMIRYPLGLPYSLLRDLDDDVTLHVVVSSSYLSSAQSNLAANGVDMGRVEFLVQANESIWTRDYGPWYVFDGAGQISIIDHTYNRSWRPNDNLIPIHFATQQGLPVFSHDMYHTGGNYMTDGAHIGSSTRLVYDEAASHNGMNTTAVNQLMSDYYGLSNYTVLEYIESGGIHHIDTWAKFLDEETVLVKRVWSAHHTYANLEQRATLLASLTSSTGQPYDVHRVDCYDIGWGDPASYTNSLMLNDFIYVPMFGDASADSLAIHAYRTAAPGYDVRGYYYSGFITDDALHCRSKGVYDAGMLRVLHTPQVEPAVGPVLIQATIESHSGQSLTDITLHYRFDQGAWSEILMSPERDGLYEGLIPAPDQNVSADYFVEAEDASGRREGAPRVAPAHWYSFELQAPTSGLEPVPASIGRVTAAPNPFNPMTTFSFELHHPGPVHLTVLDVRGQVVRKLLTGQTQPEGRSEIKWDGRDNSGKSATSGTYVFVLEAAGIRHARSVTLIR